MKFLIEGLEEGWFYLSLEDNNKKCGLIVSYHGHDMIENLCTVFCNIVSGKKKSQYFVWTQEPEYQMMYLERTNDNEVKISVFDFAKEPKLLQGDILPKAFRYDEKEVFVMSENDFVDLAKQVVSELGYYRGEGKEEYAENWIHLDKGTKIPFPEKEWQRLDIALQKKSETV